MRTDERGLKGSYAPKCVEWAFSEVLGAGFLQNSAYEYGFDGVDRECSGNDRTFL
jgi:hypothetical protein